MNRKYELVFVVSPDATEAQVTELQTQVEGIVQRMGGTIEKTYDELGGVLSNKLSVLDMLLATLELRGVTIDRVPLMNKDSLDMSEADHDLIADTAEIMSRNHDGVVIVHGTDRLAKTGDRIRFAPVVAGNLVVVQDDGGTVTAFKSRPAR